MLLKRNTVFADIQAFVRLGVIKKVWYGNDQSAAQKDEK